MLTQGEQKDLEDMMKVLQDEGTDITFGILGCRTTYCHLKAKDRWECVGLSFTKDEDNFQVDVGQYWALRDVFFVRGSRDEGDHFNEQEVAK